MTNLFHNSGLPLGEGGVPSQFVVDKLHLDFDTAFGLLAATTGAGSTAVGRRTASTSR